MNRVYADKSYEESSEIVVLDKTGGVIYLDSGSIKGRGNSTWEKEKKPFLMKLSKSMSLINDASSAKKWVLLANYFDKSNIRTKVIFDFARDLGMKETPYCEYTDLYINGEYIGLYTLCEKVEKAYERATKQSGSVLFLLDGRKGTYITNDKQHISIEEPDDVSESMYEELMNGIQRLEERILRNDDSLIDIDSWVHRYLVDEIFENIDATWMSSYFYYNNENNKYYAGPIWDYDISWGSIQQVSNPKTFLANAKWRTRNLYHSWGNTLYNSEDFKKQLLNCYRIKARKLIDRIIEYDLNPWNSHLDKELQAVENIDLEAHKQIHQKCT